MLTTLLACLFVGKAFFAQSLVDNAKHKGTEEGDRDLLDIQWMLVGHRTEDPPAHMLAISYDNKTLVSGGTIDCTVKVWDIERRVLKRTIVVYGVSELQYVDVSPDGTIVLAGSKTCCKIFRADSGQLLRTVKISSPVFGVKLTAAGTLAMRTENEAFVIDPVTMNGITNIGCFTDEGIPITPDRRMLFSHKTNEVQIFDDSGKNPVTYYNHSIEWISVTGNYRETYSLIDQTDTDDKRAVALDSNRIGTVDKSAMKVAVLGFRSRAYNTSDRIAFAVGVSRMFPSSDGGTCGVSVRSSRSKQVENYIYGSDSVSLYGVIKGVTYADMERVTSYRSKNSYALCPQGLFVFVGNSEYRGGMNVARPPVLELWNLEGRRTRGYLDNGSAICDMAVSEDGKLFACSLTEGRIKFFSRDTAEFLKFMECPRVFWNGQMIPAPMSDLVVTKDYVAGASPGPHVFVRPTGSKDIKGKHLIDPDTGWEDRAVMCRYDEGKKMLVASPMSKLGLRLMETVSGKTLRTYEPKTPLIQVLCAGKLVAGVSKKTVYFWDIETGKLVNKIDANTANVSSIAISKGKLYAGAIDGKLECYDIATGKFVREYVGHEARIIALAVSPDGKTLVSRSDDADELFCLKVWDVETAKRLHQYENEIGPMDREVPSGNAIRFTPDSKFIFFGRGDGSVVYAKLDTSAPPEPPAEIEKPKAYISAVR